MNSPRDDRRAFGSLLQLHVPKTAGRTLHALLERHFEPADVLPVLLDTRASDDRADAASAIDRARTRTLRRLGDARRAASMLARYRLVVTHDDIDLARWMSPPVAVVTLFRDPVARAHSLYRHVSRNSTHPLHRASADGGIAGFVRAADGNPRYVDRQCRQVVGGDLVGAEPERLAAQAIDVLEQPWFAYGLVERFEDSMAMMGAWLGLDLSDGAGLHVNAAPDGPRPISPEERCLLEGLNRADQMFYEAAAARFERVPAASGGPRIEGAAALPRPAGMGRKTSTVLAKARYALTASFGRVPEGFSAGGLGNVARIATGESTMRIDGDTAHGPT